MTNIYVWKAKSGKIKRVDYIQKSWILVGVVRSARVYVTPKLGLALSVQAGSKKEARFLLEQVGSFRERQKPT